VSRSSYEYSEDLERITEVVGRDLQSDPQAAGYEEKRESAQRIFRCLGVSIHPLRVKELAEILAVQFDEERAPYIYCNIDWRPAYAE